MKSIFKTYWPYALAVLAITLPWFFHRGFIFLTDFVWGPIMHLRWQESWFIPKVIIKALDLVLPLPFVQKVFVCAILWTVVIGGKRIAERYLTGRWQIFVAALFALYNPFVYDRLGYGQVGVVFAYGFLLLLAGDLIACVEKFEARRFALTGIWAGLAILFAPQFVFFCGVLYLLFLVTSIRNPESGIRRIWKPLLIAAGIVLILNANWLIAASVGQSKTADVVSSQITRADLAAFQTAGKTGWDALGNVVFMSGFWGKEQLRYTDLKSFDSTWGRSFLVLLPIIVWGIVVGLKKRRALTVGFLATVIVSIILAVGVRMPIARDITYWLFDHFPLYKGLRETQKWVAVLVVAYSSLLAIGLAELFKKFFPIPHPTLSYLRRGGAASRAIITVLLAAVIILQAPLLIWGLHGQVRPHEYPQEWYAADTLLAPNGTCDKRVLFLPWHQYMGFKWAGTVIANPASSFFHCQMIASADMEWGTGTLSPSSDLPVNLWLQSKGNTRYLHVAGAEVSYVMLAKEVDWQKYKWLDDVPDLKLVTDSAVLRIYAVKQ